MSPDSVFERPRRRKRALRGRLPWAIGGVLALVLVAVLGYHFRNTGESTATPLTNTPAVDVSKVPKTTKIDPFAEQVARRFVQTAVARRNLGEAYKLVGADIKQGQSLASWKKGNIAVIPFPLDQLDFAPMKIVYSYPKEISLEIALLPKKGSTEKAALMTLVLNKVQGKWLVNLWTPRSSPAVPNASGNVGG